MKLVRIMKIFTSIANRICYLPINVWFSGYYALIVLLWELCTSKSNTMRAQHPIY